MTIAASLPLALLAFASGPNAPVNRATPPIVIHVTTTPNIPKGVVQVARGETDAIFGRAGVSFEWCDGENVPASILVAIGNDQGPPRSMGTPLGWLMFENGAPAQTLYLSYANAERFLRDSRDVVGNVDQKTRAERELLLGRLIGRALAHELGHYLIGTKDHTERGLLKRAPTAAEFFSPDRSAFSINVAERSLIVSRLTQQADLAARHGSQPPAPAVQGPSRVPVIPQSQR